MNYHSLTGRPTRDPEIHTYHDNSGEGEIAKFTIAVNRRFQRNEKTADYFNCVAFGRQAKTVKEHVKQGKKILITGRMENNDYEKDGIKVYGYNFVIETIEFLDKKENSASEVGVDEQGYMQVPEELQKEVEEVFGA